MIISTVEDILNEVKAAKGEVSHTIGNVEYSFKLLPATAAFKLAQYVIEVAAPVLGSLFDAKQAKDSFDDDNSQFGADLGSLFAKQLQLVDIDAWAPLMLLDLKANDVKCNVDSLVGAKGLAVLMTLLELSLKENVTDFLAEWLAEKGLSLPSLTQA